MPMATMADAHREWHRNAGVPMGTPGCPQDACHLPDDGPYDDAAEAAYLAAQGTPTHVVQTAYGTVEASSLAEAKTIARQAAMTTGRRTVIQPYIAPAPAAAPSLHDSPCVCGTYDRCKGVRAQDAARSGNWRDQFRAYND